MAVFWVVAPCILVVYRLFRGTHCFHQGNDRHSEDLKSQVTMSSCSRMRGVEGTVKVNGRDRSKDSRERFSRLSCYIMQDDALRPALTVREAMTLVAHLRLGYLTSHKQKQKQVRVLLLCVVARGFRLCCELCRAHAHTHTGRHSSRGVLVGQFSDIAKRNRSSFYIFARRYYQA
jgi:hypothetical protein